MIQSQENQMILKKIFKIYNINIIIIINNNKINQKLYKIIIKKMNKLMIKIINMIILFRIH